MCYLHSLLWPCFKPGSWWHNQAVSTYEVRFGSGGRNFQAHQKFPKQDSLFQKLKSELAPDWPGFRVLFATRWTVRASSLQSVLTTMKYCLVHGMRPLVCSLILRWEQGLLKSTLRCTHLIFCLVFPLYTNNSARPFITNLFQLQKARW